MRCTRSLKSGGIDLDGYYRTTKVSSFSHVAKPKYIFFRSAFCVCNRPRSKSSPYSLGNRGIFRKIGGLSGEKRSVSSKSPHFFVGGVAWMDSPRGVEGISRGQSALAVTLRGKKSRGRDAGPRSAANGLHERRRDRAVLASGYKKRPESEGLRGERGMLRVQFTLFPRHSG